MSWSKEWRPALALIVVFCVVYFLPVGSARFNAAVGEAMHLTRWYAREHVLLCLVPAFFIAGAISSFVSQTSVMKYLGAGARKVTAYSVAAVSGSILAVCSCTVLPLFAGIYRMGAGLGPAAAFLYAGPAINVLAIILTARILGVELGIARAIGAIVFSVVIGLIMHALYRREEAAKVQAQAAMPEPPAGRPLPQIIALFAAMIALLVFATWGRPEAATGFWVQVHGAKWWLAAVAALAWGLVLVTWYGLAWWRLGLVALVPAIMSLTGVAEARLVFAVTAVALSWALITSGGELSEWFEASWTLAKQIMPLLLLGVLAAGFILGRPNHEGLLPVEWVEWAVGGNSLRANLLASFAGAFMYFATLTEVPILQGLLGAGMGQGPALALLLAGPALSLPSILVLRSIIGGAKTAVFILLVVVMATVSGVIFGSLT